MWGAKIKNPRQSNFNFQDTFSQTLLFNFVFFFVIFSIYFCFYFCICWHSADEWCHGRTSRNRTVQILILKNKMWRLWWTFYSYINLLFHVEVSTLKQFILCVVNILSDIKLLNVEPSRWCRFKNLSLLVKVTPAKVMKNEDRGSPREQIYI